MLMLPETALPVPSPRGEGLGEGGRATNFLPHFSVMRLEIIFFNARPHPGLLPRGEGETCAVFRLIFLLLEVRCRSLHRFPCFF